MSSRGRRKKHGKREYAHHSHSVPGTIVTPPDSKKPVIQVFLYGPDGYEEHTLDSVAQIEQYMNKKPVFWLNVDGLGDADAILKIGSLFSLHELALEDSVSLQQRAKAEQYGDQMFLVLKMMTYIGDHPFSEQLSLFFGKNFVITFQEGAAGDVLDPLRERIRKGTGHIRTEPPDYLMYSIVDSVVDGFFPVVEALGDNLERLEDDLLENATRDTPSKVLQMKRDVLLVRRAIWPTRDLVNALTRDDTDGLISRKTHVYMRDCYDHAMRIIDLVETQREMCSDLMDLYLSSVSNKMNEVMKVLTIITLLFMPPTLIAGIYGMNFNTAKSPWNMPELEWHFGYPYAIVLMVITAFCFYRFAVRKGWIEDPSAVAESDTSDSNNGRS